MSLENINKIETEYLLPFEILDKAISESDEEFEKNLDDYKKFGISYASDDWIEQFPKDLKSKTNFPKNIRHIQSARIFKEDGTKMELLNLSNKSIAIENCELSEDISFSNKDSGEKNESYLFIINCDVEKIELGELKLELFYVDNLKAKYLTSPSMVNECSLNQSKIALVSFWGCKVNILKMDDCKVDHLRFLWFNNSEFNVFKSRIKHIWFTDMSEFDGIGISNSDISSFKMDFGIKAKHLKILGSEINSFDSSLKCQVENLVIESSSLKSILLGLHQGGIKLVNCSILEFKIMSCYLTKLEVINCNELNLDSNGSIIYYLHLINVNIKNGKKIIFDDITVHACIFESVDVSGHLKLRKIKASSDEYISPRGIINSPYHNMDLNDQLKLVMKEYHKQVSTFRIRYSSLGKTEFIDCKFSSFGSFEIYNSRISEVYLLGYSFLSNNVSVYGIERNSEEWFEQMESYHHQLSIVFRVQGNLFESFRHISISNKYKMGLLQKQKDWINYFPYKFNKWSSQFGSNWLKAVWFLIWTSAMLYLFSLISIGIFSNYSEIELKNLGHSFYYLNPLRPFDFYKIISAIFVIEWKFIGYYFDYLNPLRPFDFYTIIGLVPNVCTRAIDLLSRVIIGYGIYQLIISFKRFSHK